jgi:lipopolysaccharide export system permease protein
LLLAGYNRGMIKAVDRMVLKEALGPFLFGVAMFSMLTIATVVLQEAARFVIRYNLSAGFFLKLFLLAMPQFIVLSIPMGSLLGTLLSAGRLNSDLEIIALRACGISLYRVLLPYFVLGLFLTGVTFIGTERVVPAANSAMKEMKQGVLAGRSKEVQGQRISWPIIENGQLRWQLFAGEVDGTTLKDVKLFYFDPKPAGYGDFWLHAERATWQGDYWVFYNMRMVTLQEASRGGERVIVEFVRYEMPDFRITPESLSVRNKDANDLTARQLGMLIRELVKGGTPATDKAVLDLKTNYYFKFAIPFTPLFFILIAVPLAIRPQRSTSALGMGIALLIVLAYYALFTVSQKLGAVGVLPPLLAAWSPNTLMVALGGYLLWQRDRN